VEIETRKEEKQERSNDKVTNLNDLIQSMVEGVILQDNTGKILQYNQAALEILGLTEDQLKARDFISSGEGDLSEWEKNFPGKSHIGMDSLKTQKSQGNVVVRIFRRDGLVKWISLNAVPILSQDKKLSQLLCTFTDITDMRRALNDLKQVQLLFNISHDLMIIANLEGYFKRINPRFINLLGYNLNEILSEKFLNFVHPDDYNGTELEIKNLLSKKESVHFINRYKTKNNEYRVFDWVVVPDPETSLLYFTARDITDYRAEELDIINSSKVYSIGELTSGIAFLLSAQVSIISSNISFLQYHEGEKPIDSKILKEKITSIEESVQILSKTIKELITYSRNIENERVANISLNRILDNIIGLCKERFRIHGVKLSIKLEGELIIHSRESQIAHVFISLLNTAYNAVHSQRDSWVELLGTTTNGQVHISIAFNCPPTGTFDQKNLKISKGIIEENFGTFTLDQSSPQTKFIIEFPIVATTSQQL
jgi:PAS domain S-box-containing protein